MATRMAAQKPAWIARLRLASATSSFITLRTRRLSSSPPPVASTNSQSRIISAQRPWRKAGVMLLASSPSPIAVWASRIVAITAISSDRVREARSARWISELLTSFLHFIPVEREQILNLQPERLRQLEREQGRGHEDFILDRVDRLA